MAPLPGILPATSQTTGNSKSAKDAEPKEIQEQAKDEPSVNSLNLTKKDAKLNVQAGNRVPVQRNDLDASAKPFSPPNHPWQMIGGSFHPYVRKQPKSTLKKCSSEGSLPGHVYSSYMETDLDGPDQPTDFSQKYQEHMNETDDFEAPHSLAEYVNDDTLKVYCTEGTPLNFSTASSLTDLREIHLANLDAEAAKQTEKTKPKISFLRPERATAPAGKSVTFGNEINYSTDTPLMFSRSSSLGSLSSFEQQSIHDDRSSVVSDFSRRTSEVVSPSDLPDSPSQTMPSSPHRTRFSPGVFHFSNARPGVDNPKSKSRSTELVSEDSVRVYADEGSYSITTSLSSLTFEDKPSNENESLFATIRESPVGEDRENSTANGFRDETVGETNGSLDMLASQMNNLKVSNSTGEASETSETETDENELLSACIRSGMPGNNNICLIQPPKMNNYRTASSPSPKGNAELVSDPLKLEGVFEDQIKVYEMEGTPSVLSHATSLSNLSLISNADSESHSECETNSNQCHVFSYFSTTIPGHKFQPVNVTLQPVLPKGILIKNLKGNTEAGSAVSHNPVCASQSRPFTNNYSESLVKQNSPSKPSAHSRHGVWTTFGSYQQSPSGSLPSDTLHTYAVEGTPVIMSDNTSVSSITSEDILRETEIPTASKPVTGFTLQNNGPLLKPVPRIPSGIKPGSDGFKDASSLQDTSSQVLPDSYRREETPLSLSRNNSLSGESVDELSEGEEALLEECINAGKPKSKVKPTDPKEKIAKGNRKLLNVDAGHLRHQNKDGACRNHMLSQMSEQSSTGFQTSKFLTPDSPKESSFLLREAVNYTVARPQSPPPVSLRESFSSPQNSSPNVESADELSAGEEALLEECINAGKPKSRAELVRPNSSTSDNCSSKCNVRICCGDGRKVCGSKSTKVEEFSVPGMCQHLECLKHKKECLECGTNKETISRNSSLTMAEEAFTPSVHSSTYEIQKSCQLEVFPPSLSPTNSVREESPDELSEGEQALLEECINAGKPKSKPVQMVHPKPRRSSKNTDKNLFVEYRCSDESFKTHGKYSNAGSSLFPNHKQVGLDSAYVSRMPCPSNKASSRNKVFPENHSPNEESAEELSASEEALLEECINAGKPKVRPKARGKSSRHEKKSLTSHYCRTGHADASETVRQSVCERVKHANHCAQLQCQSSNKLCRKHGKDGTKRRTGFDRKSSFTVQTEKPSVHHNATEQADASELKCSPSTRSETSASTSLQSNCLNPDSPDELSAGEEALLQECINAGKPKSRVKVPNKSSRSRKNSERGGIPVYCGSPARNSGGAQVKLDERQKAKVASRSKESSQLPGPNTKMVTTEPTENASSHNARLFVPSGQMPGAGSELSANEQALVDECISAGRPKPKVKYSAKTEKGFGYANCKIPVLCGHGGRKRDLQISLGCRKPETQVSSVPFSKNLSRFKLPNRDIGDIRNDVTCQAKVGTKVNSNNREILRKKNASGPSTPLRPTTEDKKRTGREKPNVK